MTLEKKIRTLLSTENPKINSQNELINYLHCTMAELKQLRNEPRLKRLFNRLDKFMFENGARRTDSFVDYQTKYIIRPIINKVKNPGYKNMAEIAGHFNMTEAMLKRNFKRDKNFKKYIKSKWLDKSTTENVVEQTIPSTDESNVIEVELDTVVQAEVETDSALQAEVDLCEEHDTVQAYRDNQESMIITRINIQKNSISDFKGFVLGESLLDSPQVLEVLEELLEDENRFILTNQMIEELEHKQEEFSVAEWIVQNGAANDANFICVDLYNECMKAEDSAIQYCKENKEDVIFFTANAMSELKARRQNIKSFYFI